MLMPVWWLVILQPLKAIHTQSRKYCRTRLFPLQCFYSLKSPNNEEEKQVKIYENGNTEFFVIAGIGVLLTQRHC